MIWWTNDNEDPEKMWLHIPPLQVFETVKQPVGAVTALTEALSCVTEQQ